MKVKKFTASTMQEAMNLVKQELGGDAVILQTRTLPKTFFGLLPRKRVEVTAAAEVAVAADVVRPKAEVKPKGEAFPALPTDCRSEDSPADTPVLASRLNSLEDKIAKLTSTVETLVEKSLPGQTFSGEWAHLFQRLLLTGMEEALARCLVEDLSSVHENPEAVLEDETLLIEQVETALSANGNIKLPEEGQRVVVLIGPTGVGKTTTLAKIAAEFLKDGRKIAFITADTYRLAAVEQLQKYADIMGLCLETVYSAAEMEQAIARYSDKELVFVDTAGRSQRNSGQMEELKAFVSACQPADVHLLLSATTKREDLEEIIERFSVCPIDHLILTKSDESICFGPFYSVAKRTSIPFSYITTGQNVPEDIEVASTHKIARLICRGALETDEPAPESDEATPDESVPSAEMELKDA